jgi:hypothetical protein
LGVGGVTEAPSLNHIEVPVREPQPRIDNVT